MQLRKIWWLWVPLVVLGIQIAHEFLFTEEELAHIMSERGWVEQVQFIILVLAAGVSAALLLRMKKAAFSWLGLWGLLAFACCVYVGGEEISWGQHFFNWDTPEYWKIINDQHETNVHNTSSWLDQKPRLILLLGITTGGVVFPLLQKYKPGLLPPRFAVLYPPSQLMLVALLVLVPHLLEKVAGLFDVVLLHRTSEVQELYMYYFVLLYMATLYRRIVDKRV